MSEQTIELSNYDILVDCYYKNEEEKPGEESKMSGEEGGEMAEFYLNTTRNHVGNNRLEVLLNINRLDYTAFKDKGDETGCNNVVKKVIDIVCNQCVPKGRFLTKVKHNKKSYEELADPIILAVVRRAIENINENHNNKMYKGPDFRPRLGAQSTTTGGDSESGSSMAAEDDDDADLKRRRRSSLLRRSVSESQLVGFLRGDKKKTLRKLMEEGGDTTDENEEEPRKPRRKRSVIKAADVNNLDIVFNMSENRLVINDSKFYGNNRLKVLISLQIQKFIKYEYEEVEVEVVEPDEKIDEGNEDATERSERTEDDLEAVRSSLATEKLGNITKPAKATKKRISKVKTVVTKKPEKGELEKIINDTINAVEKSWGGRFISESTLSYTKMDHDEAFKALQKLILGQLYASASAKTDDDDDGYGQYDAEEVKPDGVVSSSGDGPKRPSDIKQAALIAISDGIGLSSDDEMSTLRSEAVKSLQRRKGKQKLNNRIRGLTAKASNAIQDGVSPPVLGGRVTSAASVGSVTNGLRTGMQQMDLGAGGKPKSKRFSAFSLELDNEGDDDFAPIPLEFTTNNPSAGNVQMPRRSKQRQFSDVSTTSTISTKSDSNMSYQQYF